MKPVGGIGSSRSVTATLSGRRGPYRQASPAGPAPIPAPSLRAGPDGSQGQHVLSTTALSGADSYESAALTLDGITSA